MTDREDPASPDASSRTVDRWAYGAQFVSVASAIVILPLLLRAFDARAMGLWYVFVTLGLLATLSDGALEPTVARHVATAVAEDSRPALSANPGARVREVLRASRRAYGLAALFLGLVLFGPAAAFVWHVSREGSIGRPEALGAWGLFALSLIVSSSLGYVNPALQGGSSLAVFYRMVCVQRSIGTFCTLMAAVFRPTIPALAAAALVGAVASRAYAFAVFRRTFPAMPGGARHSAAPRSDTRRILVDGFRLGGAQFGAFLILRSNVLIASSVLGLKVAASYALSMQCFDLISTFSITPFQARLPRLYRLLGWGEQTKFSALAGKSLLVAWVSFTVLSLAFLAAGPTVLSVIRAGTPLLSRTALVALAVVLALEMNHALAGTLITASGKIPFTEAAVASGIAVPLLSYVLATQTSWGVFALIGAQGLVQAAYNNWKWPMEMCRVYGTSYRELIRYGLARRS